MSLVGARMCNLWVAGLCHTAGGVVFLVRTYSKPQLQIASVGSECHGKISEGLDQ